MRIGKIERKTKETQIKVSINLDGCGQAKVNTGIGFFDHMLTLFSFHSGIDLDVKAQGDLEVCDHHTVEDCGIAMGQALKEALGEKRGIYRYGSFTLPMDETLCNVTLDISGRPYLVFHAAFKREQIGSFSTEMVEEFFRALAVQAGLTLHINVYYGANDHHQIEAMFKALGRALREAIEVNGNAIPSTKGWIEV